MAEPHARQDELIPRFVERAAEYRAGVHQCGPTELAATLARVLADATAVVVPAGIPPQWTELVAAPRRADDGLTPRDLDETGIAVLTGCALAIAETGTIVLDAGPTQGRRVLTLVPDHHVCVVEAGQIVADVPDMVTALPDPTRPITLISGPSATSDIELNRVEGVHGPRRLDIICVIDR
jgi:L-lactate dehydrogenase complex protein LldG